MVYGIPTHLVYLQATGILFMTCGLLDIWLAIFRGSLSEPSDVREFCRSMHAVITRYFTNVVLIYGVP